MLCNYKDTSFFCSYKKKKKSKKQPTVIRFYIELLRVFKDKLNIQDLTIISKSVCTE